MARAASGHPADALGRTNLRAALAEWWSAWKEFAKRIGEHQSAIMLSLVYLVVGGPVWLVLRITRRRLLPYAKDVGSTWLPRRSDPRTLADLERPF